LIISGRLQGSTACSAASDRLKEISGKDESFISNILEAMYIYFNYSDRPKYIVSGNLIDFYFDKNFRFE
jgi:hypothetical protein